MVSAEDFMGGDFLPLTGDLLLYPDGFILGGQKVEFMNLIKFMSEIIIN